ncbi:hypothetical protein HN873_067410, partial [Arachis hypogaea]
SRRHHRHRQKRGKRTEREGEDEFSSLLYAQLSLVLPIPPLLLRRRLRSSSPSPRLLIFDNIENGSLKEHLNDPLKTLLNWRMRLQIANEVVATLEYLFFFSDPPAYHVSISSSNIMLDENFAAKIRKHFFSH